MGITETQYAITKHTDRQHLHVHLIANMVNNKGESISDSWIGWRGKKVAQQLTQQYGLIPAQGKSQALTNENALSSSEGNKYKIYKAIHDTLPHCRTLEELEIRLKEKRIVVQYKYKGQTKERQGISFKLDGDCFKGSKIDRQYSLSRLEQTLTQQRQLLLQEQQQKQLHQNKRGLHR